MDIKLYHTSSCPQCKLVEKMLAVHGIDYESCTDVDEMAGLGITRVPVLAVGDKLLSGKEIFSWAEEQK